MAAAPVLGGITPLPPKAVNVNCALGVRKPAMRTDFCWHMLQNCYLSSAMDAVPPSSAQPARAWTDFWRGAPANGCTAAFPPQAAAGIAQGWRRLLAGVAPGNTLIDIACGRGAILQLARQSGLADAVGVDLAAIADADPAIRSGIDAAALPCQDREFSIAVSQFGIEYAGLQVAGLEAARVADRHLWLLVHAADGPVVAQALEQVAQAAWLTGADGPITQLARQASAPGAPGAAAIEQLRTDLVTRADTAANTSLLEAVWQAAGAQLARPDPAAITALRDDIAAYAERLQLMAAAAPDAAAVAALGQQLEQRGFAVTITPEGAPPLARWIIATRF